MTIDILAFDAASDCLKGYDLELTQPDGVTLTGITVTVLGEQADEVQGWQARVADKMRREEWLARKKGQEPQPTPLDDLKEQAVEGAAIRVTGWKGVKQAFDRELLKTALRRNRHWIDQIVAASNDLGNFGGRAQKNSSSTPDTNSA